jgi:hypothetical protein
MPHPPNTQIALYADDTAILTQSWRTDTIAWWLTHAMTILQKYFTKWKLRVNINKTEAILFTKHHPAIPCPLQFQHTAIPWRPHIRYLGLVLDSKLLFTKHLHCYTQGHWYFPQTLPPPRPRLHTIPTQQTHPIQITDPPCTHLRCPRLEQYIVC